jgi:hypothetical protein
VQCPVLKKEHLSKIGNGMSMYFDSPNDVFSCRDGKIRLLGRINVGTGIRKLFHARLGVDKREKSVKVLTAPEPVTVSDVDRKLPLCVYSSRMWDLPDFTAFSPSFYPREVSSENRKTNVRRIALFNTYDCNFKTSGPVKKKDVMAFRVGVPVYEGKEQELSADENFFPTKWRLLPGFPEYDTKRDHPWKGNGGAGMVRIRGSAGFPGKLELAQGNTHYEVPFSQLGRGSVGSPERVNPNLLFFRIRRWGLAYLETREVNSEVTVSVITLRDFGRVRALISPGGVLRASYDILDTAKGYLAMDILIGQAVLGTVEFPVFESETYLSQRRISLINDPTELAQVKDLKDAQVDVRVRMKHCRLYMVDLGSSGS